MEKGLVLVALPCPQALRLSGTTVASCLRHFLCSWTFLLGLEPFNMELVGNTNKKATVLEVSFLTGMDLAATQVGA